MKLLRMEPDSGITNIRSTSSSHWRRWLGADNRYVVPFTSFSEWFDPARRGRGKRWQLLKETKTRYY